MSEADKALYQRAKQSGTVYENRDQATESFRKTYGSQYKTTFSEEPKSRPSYIPTTYSPPSSSGSSYTVVYNRDRGGYGYWSGGGPGLGTFMLYDALSDAAVASALMSQKGYYYGPQPVSSVGGGSVLAVVLVILIVLIIGAAIAARGKL